VLPGSRSPDCDSSGFRQGDSQDGELEEHRVRGMWLPREPQATIAVTAGMAVALLGYAVLPAAPLALLALAAFTVLAYVQPRLGLAAVLATLPTYLYQRELGGVAVSLPEAALLLTGAATVARGLLRRDVAPRATAFDAGAAILLVAALLSLLPSEYLKLSVRALRTLILEPVLFYYLVVSLAPTVRALRPLTFAFLAAAGAVALLAIGQVLWNVHTVEVEGARRALGTYLSPNHLGLYLGRALPFALALALWTPAARPYGLALGAVLGLALALTFSGGAWLGAGASVLALAAIRGRRILLLAAAGGATVAALGLALLARLGVERVVDNLSMGGATATFRRQIWTSALAMLRDHPLLGIGLDNFLYRYQLHHILPEAWREPNISHPHNWVLQFWLDLGLLGLVAAVGLLGRFFWIAIRRLRGRADDEQRALIAAALASMVGLLVHGAVDNSYFLPDLAVLFWWHVAIAGIAAQPAPSGAAPQPATVG
jgi:O-antigen ligase